MPSPAPPPPDKTSEQPAHEARSRSQLIAVAAVVIVMLIGIVAVFVYFPQLRLQSNQDGSVSDTLERVAYFPRLSDIRAIRPDHTDPQYLWLLTMASVMRIDTKSQEITDYTREISGTEGQILTDLVHVGDTLFTGMQGGLIEYDLNTKKSTRYTKNDGLVSNSNIALTVDPADEDVLWIGTFEGLSKFSISSRTFENFVSEMGIPGSALQPRVFHVDDRYVWLTVSSNAYTTGGVARLDKQTGIWKHWGYEFFEAVSPDGRFDTYGAAADGDHAIVEQDGVVFSYDPEKDTWLPITAYKQTASVKREFILKGMTAFFWAGTIKELNIDTRVERNLLQPSMFTRTDVSLDAFAKNLLRLEFDRVNNRLIVYPEQLSHKNGIGIMDFDTRDVAMIPSASFIRTFSLFNVTLADARGSHIIVNGEEGLVDYDWTQKMVRNLLPYTVDVAKIVADKVVALNLATCEVYCDIKTLTASTTIISLDTAKIESAAILTGTTTEAYYIGDSPSEVYLLNYTYKDTHKGYKFDTQRNEFSLVNLSDHQWVPLEWYAHPDTRAVVSSPDGSRTVSFDRGQKGDVVSLTIQDSNGEREVQVPMGPAQYNHWSTDTSTNINSSVFDARSQHIFWIGTNRGLIRLNVQTREGRLFTIDDGLSSNEIYKIVSAGDVLVVEDQAGVSAYRF